MRRTKFFCLTVLAIIQFGLMVTSSVPSFAREWKIQKPKGTIRVVDLFSVPSSINLNYAEGLVTLDENNNYVPCLGEDWRWIDDRTIEFKLRRGVLFHNGEEFNAEAVKVNWEAYRKMESTRPVKIQRLPQGTTCDVIDKYMVRFILPEPNSLALVKFFWFYLIAPSFFEKNTFPENNWAIFAKAGPWGTGAFEFVEGGLSFGKYSDRVVLKAFDRYWDRRYPKVEKIIFNNTLTKNKKEAMRLCTSAEGQVDLVSYIRPLDTLGIAESEFAKVVKSKDVMAFYGFFNQRKRESKWKDIRLRRAINYAINREELLRYGAKGNAHNLGGHITPGAYGYNPNLTLYSYDTSKAKSLLSEAGYPDGFKLKMIAHEAWNLEAQIIGRMLARVGIEVEIEVLPIFKMMRKYYMPLLEKNPEQQDWDISTFSAGDWFAHPAASLLTYGLLEDSNFRWIEYDPEYEEMWKDMVGMPEAASEEKKISQMMQYVYDKAYLLFIYSPLSLYAVNKEVNFVPQKLVFLRLKETSVTDNHWSVRGKNN